MLSKDTTGNRSERKQAARDTARLINTLMENSHEGIMILDGLGNVRRVNQAFINMAGVGSAQLLGRNIVRFVQQDLRAGLLEEVREELWQSGFWQGKLSHEQFSISEDLSIEAKVSAILPERGRVRYYLVQITLRGDDEDEEEGGSRDELTGLPSRLLFEDRLQQAISQASRHRNCLGAMFLGLDAERIKLIRDSLGHDQADELIQEVAVRLGECLRTTDSVARMGDTSFALLLSDLNEHKDAVRNASVVARKVYESLVNPVTVSGQPVEINAAMGITLYPADGKNPRELLLNAETALNHARQRGWNNYQFFSSEMTEAARERFELETSLRMAIERDEMLLYYQPQVDLESGDIIGAEALVRWRHSEKGLISPGQFIPVAEETGLIVPIGEWVLRTAVKQIATWKELGLKPVRMGVNLSALQFKRQDLAALVAELLEQHDLDPSLLDLEITESAIMDDTERAIDMLNRISALGVKLSIDDFGTGYSSLSQLRQFPFQTLKIDRSFVTDLSKSGDKAIVSAIIAMAHSLEQTVIVEGIEELDQLSVMKELKCNEMQGFLFSAPLPAEEFTQLLKDGRKLDE
uniref:Putative Diguanylate cyclase/phosphodiesterase with PAS/PAC sensor n=1 Tax=Magnetococcus massalia (strain MO-1) TaxID=451514 RepID=A0A1S7LEN6_MAGMO|nr:putative Diguanylate cyclase/phosphodiesterase with PAS/PAC sensor [Candidatus Magnetococcus massalia]